VVVATILEQPVLGSRLGQFAIAICIDQALNSTHEAHEKMDAALYVGALPQHVEAFVQKLRQAHKMHMTIRRKLNILQDCPGLFYDGADAFMVSISLRAMSSILDGLIQSASQISNIGPPEHPQTLVSWSLHAVFNPL
jgi:hypothetical protein